MPAGGYNYVNTTHGGAIMAVRTRQMGWGAAWTDMFRQRPALREGLAQAGHFLLGLSLGAGRLFGGAGPFGIAGVAAAGSDMRGFLTLLGTGVGYVISGGVFPGIRYIAAAFVVFTLGYLTQSLTLRRQRWFMPVVAACALALSGALYGLGTVGGLPAQVRLFLEVVLSGGCAYFFSLVLDKEDACTEAAELRRSISVAILAGCALMGLAGIKIFNTFSVGRTACMMAVMTAGFCGGMLPGCAAGCAMGLAMDMAGRTAIFCGAAYPLAGLVAGGLYRYGRLTFAVSFCAANAVAVLLAWGEQPHVEALYECFVASVLFMLLPQSALTPVGSLLQSGKGQGETAFRLYQAQRLEHLSQGFRRLYECASRPEPDRSPRGESGAVLDRAADTVCRTCSGKEQCWKKDGSETARLLSPMLDSIAGKSGVTAADLPAAFRQRCSRAEAFAGAVNGELRGVRYRRQYRARLKEGRAAAYGQFMDMAEVMERAAKDMSGTAGPDGAAERRLSRYLRSRELDGVCSVFRDGRGRLHAVLEGAGVEALEDEPDYLERLSEAVGVRICRVGGKEPGRMALRQAEPLAVSVGIASMKKEGESVSGDRGTYFKTDGGLLCVILSDGMGTGEDAARESVAAVEILEELLKAGMEPGCAMRLLNSAAMLKNGEDWGYATVDLCCIDLFTGDTRFYKYGAAPSYIKTGRAIRRVKCTSLAAGMLAGEGSAPDMVRMRLRPGNVALIASDGVLAEKNDQWLRDILAGSDGVETKALAKSALRAAVVRFGNADDMTALAIRVEQRQ